MVCSVAKAVASLLAITPAVAGLAVLRDEGTPAVYSAKWTGLVNGTTTTLYGDSAMDLMLQLYYADPAMGGDNKTNVLARKIAKGIEPIARDTGSPYDLPDIGIPDMWWKGPGGPFFDFTNGPITYPYSCGNWATADGGTSRKAAYELRNMPYSEAKVNPQTCSRMWCHDTTAVFMCNPHDEERTVPMYNVGWLADRILRFCCDNNDGKSGQMWHYDWSYSVVVGYANCNAEAETNQPYPYGDGNNAACRAAKPISADDFFRNPAGSDLHSPAHRTDAPQGTRSDGRVSRTPSSSQATTSSAGSAGSAGEVTFASLTGPFFGTPSDSPGTTSSVGSFDEASSAGLAISAESAGSAGSLGSAGSAGAAE